MQSLFPFNIEAPLGLQNVLQNAFSHRFIFFSTTIGLMKGSRMSRRISRKAWLQRNLCTSGGVETSLRAPPVLFYTEEDTILRFVEFHLHGLCYVAEYIRRTDTCIADNTMDFSRGMFHESFERSGISINFHDTVFSEFSFVFFLIIIIFSFSSHRHLLVL